MSEDQDHRTAAPRGIMRGTVRIAGGLLARSASSLNRTVLRPAMSFAAKPLSMAAKPLAAAARHTVDFLNEIATDVATAGVSSVSPAETPQLAPASPLRATPAPSRSACETPEPTDDSGHFGQLEAMATGRFDELPVDSHAWALTAEQARAGSAVWRAAHSTSQRLYAQRAARATGRRVALPTFSSPEIERQRVAVLNRASASRSSCACAGAVGDGAAAIGCAECAFSDDENGHEVAPSSIEAEVSAACTPGTDEEDAVDAAAMRALALFHQVKRSSSSGFKVGAPVALATTGGPLSPLAECAEDAEAEGVDLAASCQRSAPMDFDTRMSFADFTRR